VYANQHLTMKAHANFGSLRRCKKSPLCVALLSRGNRKSDFWQSERGLCAPVTQWQPAWCAKKIHLQHEQSISATDQANQRFLGKQKSEREMCDRSRKRWLGGQRDRSRPRPLNYYHYEIILQRLVAPI
jgi:hypothetical protein